MKRFEGGEKEEITILIRPSEFYPDSTNKVTHVAVKKYGHGVCEDYPKWVEEWDEDIYKRLFEDLPYMIKEVSEYKE